MAKLHELLAVENDLKGQKDRILNETIATFEKRKAHFQGSTKTYTPLEEGGETFPPEEEQMVTTVPERIAYTKQFLVRYMDAVVSKECTNSQAKATIEIEGLKVEDVPAQALLNLEGRLKEIRRVIETIPTLDMKIKWQSDDTQENVWRSESKKSFRTQKRVKHNVVVPATEHHPAQVATDTIDERVGEWETIQFSGAIASIKKADYLRKCDKLLTAVKKARQRANCQEVKPMMLGNMLFDYIIAE